MVNTDEEAETFAMAPRNEFDVKKLRGSENYHTWQFAMMNYLELNGLEKCIQGTQADPKVPLETKADKLSQAKSRLALSVDESLFVHIRKAKTALEIWTTLQNLFEDNGLIRKIGLLRALISVRLDNVSSMQSYVEEIMTTSNKLSGIGFDIDDEWLGAILLAGLTDEFKPLIMSLEGSGIKITADSVKQKLLDAQVEKIESGEAYFTKKKWNHKSKGKDFICYSCGGKNHKSVDCNQNDGRSSSSENDSVNPAIQRGSAKITFAGVNKNKGVSHNPLGLNGPTGTAFLARFATVKENPNEMHQKCQQKQRSHSVNITSSPLSKVRYKVEKKSVAVRDASETVRDSDGRNSIESVDCNGRRQANSKVRSQFVDLESIMNQIIAMEKDGKLVFDINNEASKNGVPKSEVFGCLLNLIQGSVIGDDSRLSNNYSMGHWKAVKQILLQLHCKVDRKMEWMSSHV